MLRLYTLLMNAFLLYLYFFAYIPMQTYIRENLGDPVTALLFIGCHTQSELCLRARDQSCLPDHSCLYIRYDQICVIIILFLYNFFIDL